MGTDPDEPGSGRRAPTEGEGETVGVRPAPRASTESGETVVEGRGRSASIPPRASPSIPPGTTAASGRASPRSSAEDDTSSDPGRSSSSEPGLASGTDPVDRTTTDEPGGPTMSDEVRGARGLASSDAGTVSSSRGGAPMFALERVKRAAQQRTGPSRTPGSSLSLTTVADALHDDEVRRTRQFIVL